MSSQCWAIFASQSDRLQRVITAVGEVHGTPYRHEYRIGLEKVLPATQ